MVTIKNAKLRNTIRITVPCLLIPLLIILGALIFRDRLYLFTAFAVVALALLLFIAGFERSDTGSRRMVLVAVMTALSVVGRFIPFFKPISALTIITAIYLGPESGFLVGALSAFISNIFFGQGPWTPFQMFAWGMIGFVAGLMPGLLKKSRAALLIFGLLAGLAYSFIMDIWTVMWASGEFNGSLYLAALVTAIPHTLMYSLSNLIFLMIFAKPFGEKLDRIKIKYGV